MKTGSDSELTQKGWINEPEYSHIKKIMPLPCVDLLIMNNNKMLIMKRNNPPLQNDWFTPGSRVLLGENLEDAVKRTLKEETGMSAYKIEQIGAMSQIFDELQSITTFYKVYVKEQEILMNSEHSDYKWIGKEDVNIHPYIIHMIEMAKIF